VGGGGGGTVGSLANSLDQVEDRISGLEDKVELEHSDKDKKKRRSTNRT
jgi:hypothetical protein